MSVLNVLVACEESQAVCTAFRKLGHNAYSCDLYKCSGGHPEWHINGDCLPLLNGNCEFVTSDNAKHYLPKKWDLIIAHPPCTFLTVTSNRWFNVEKYGDKAIQRQKDREEAADFFMEFVNADCDHIAIENPVGVMSTRFRKADQCIQPYQFGEPYEKKTALWLIGLPPLKPTNVVEPAPRVKFKSGKTMAAWYNDAYKLPKEERAQLRSKTFHGIAEAMAVQWSSFIEGETPNESVCNDNLASKVQDELQKRYTVKPQKKVQLVQMPSLFPDDEEEEINED